MSKKPILILSMTLTILFICSLFIGSWNITIVEVWNILINGDIQELNKTMAILKVRLPRILLSIVCGAILAVCGVVCQACFQNPLVDPFFLGISSGSAFGVAFAIVFYLNPLIFTPIFTIFASAIPLIFALKDKSRSMLKLLFMGIIINSLFSSLLSILKVMSEIGQLREITFWLMGSLANGNFNDITRLYIIFIIGFLFFLYLAPKIDLISLGELHAYEQGINVKVLKFILLGIVAILMAYSVLLTGIISWIGLGVPHLTRLIWKTSTARKLLIYSALSGANLLLLCDLITRSISKFTLLNGRILGELPISVSTSFFGAIFLILFLFNNPIKGIKHG